VFQGHLFVGRQLLAESPLRDHPLTPMRDSDLVRLLGRQTPAPVSSVDRSLAGLAGARGHVLVDAVDDADLDRLAAALASMSGPVLLGGAAGLAAALARADTGDHRPRPAREPAPAPGAPRLIVSGSCSRRTQEQVAAFGGPVVRLEPLALAGDAGAAVAAVVEGVRSAYTGGAPTVLVSSTAAAGARADVPAGTAERLEAAAGAVAAAAVRDLGVRRLMVADGSLALLLKSGNFGAVDLFTTAWEVCP
jgi:uncharacterized protein YgbK (DUF1537 family)